MFYKQLNSVTMKPHVDVRFFFCFFIKLLDIMQSLKKSSLYVLSINFIIFIFFPTLFLVKGGHNIASVGLCGIALIYLISRLLNREELDSLPRAEKIWMLCLLFYSATFLLSFFCEVVTIFA